MTDEAVEHDSLVACHSENAAASDQTRRARRRLVNQPTGLRLLFAGPVGAGKTTAIRALSDVPPVDTDVPISAGSAEYGDGDKTTTTVGLDYGAWKPTPEITVALVGTPGQDRFAPARHGSPSRGDRVLLWLRADRGSLAADARTWIPRFADARSRLVIAISHCTDHDLDEARRSLTETLSHHEIPVTRVLAADARDRESVMRVACVALDLPEEES